MAKYNNIFWLDDRPDFLELFFRETVLSREDLFSRITWSYDFEDGVKKVNANYDLYILDGDFPDVLGNKERKISEDCLQKIRINTCGERLLAMSDPISNNFARFYRKFLIKTKSPVVVLSMSTLAPIVAFSLGLPFYCKGGLNEECCKDDAKLWRDHIKREAEIEDKQMDLICANAGVDRKSIDLGRLTTYECGSAIHFIQKYLL